MRKPALPNHYVLPPVTLRRSELLVHRQSCSLVSGRRVIGNKCHSIDNAKFAGEKDQRILTTRWVARPVD